MKVVLKISPLKLASDHGLGNITNTFHYVNIFTKQNLYVRYTLPFDRHDWVVDRCGEKVTYVIDFYSGKQDPNRPMSLSFYLDVRPAVSPAGLWDRLRMSFKKGQFM